LDSQLARPSVAAVLIFTRPSDAAVLILTFIHFGFNIILVGLRLFCHLFRFRFYFLEIASFSALEGQVLI
ncbi:hypothetical protein PMAYCL1PPCAC_04375, partial [Pristionchus mayeri]